MEMAGTPVAQGNGEYTVNIEITLNSSGSSSEDDINIIVTAGDEKIVVPVEKGTLKYDIEVVADVDDEIKAVVEGTQILPKGVYFYAPKADDVNGDGVATAREVSQNLVGVAMGETPIYSEKVLEFEDVTFKGGSVSNISYMSINKETGEVEFIKKIDVDEGCTSAPIITADGYVSVMFMKQATSGMFWFSEEVDEDVQQAAIDCLIDNNPSYKGHNAIAFGKGEHDLEFKKGKVVTYTFNAGEVVIGKDTTAEEPVEEPSVEEPTVEEPFVEEPTVETPTVEEPVVSAPDVAVEGADITSKTVVNGVTAVYIKGEGKVPDVIWTSSKEVDADIIADLIKEFGADEDAKILSDFGTHKIEYQHNKNKTKTVKYTFEEV